MDEPDEILMRQVADEDPASLEPLVRRYARPLLTFITRLVGSLQRSEDIFQEVFIAVWKHRSTYRYPAQFRPWLYKIALNKCREVQRRQSLTWSDLGEFEPATEGRHPNSDAGSPGATAMATETAAFVTAAVARLPEKQRIVVVMRVWNGLSYAEIATTLGSREATVRSHMHDALKNLRGQLEPRLREC